MHTNRHRRKTGKKVGSVSKTLRTLKIIVFMKYMPFITFALLFALVLIICYQDTIWMYNISATVSNTRLGIFPTVLSIILFLGFCIIRFVKFKNKKLKAVLMSGIFLLWLLAGRVVGYPDLPKFIKKNCQSYWICKKIYYFCTVKKPHSSSWPRTPGFHPGNQGFESPMRYERG